MPIPQPPFFALHRVQVDYDDVDLERITGLLVRMSMEGGVRVAHVLETGPRRYHVVAWIAPGRRDEVLAALLRDADEGFVREVLGGGRWMVLRTTSAAGRSAPRYVLTVCNGRAFYSPRAARVWSEGFAVQARVRGEVLERARGSR